MTLDRNYDTQRVKFVYNAQFPAPTAVVLDYLLRNRAFTPHEGRQLGMDAMMAFYRPMAEESEGNLSEAELQSIAQHCVKQLAQQIDRLCHRYHLESPIADHSAGMTGNFGNLEAVLERGLQKLCEAIQKSNRAITKLQELGIDPDELEDWLCRARLKRQ